MWSGKWGGGVFLGEFKHKLDRKGRLIMPARFRSELEETFMITRGLDRCLFAYTPEEWTKIEQQLRSLPFTQSNARAFSRFFFSGASECQLDSQGRVLVPANLRKYAEFKKEVVVIGVSNRIELWAEDRWQTYAAEAETSYEDMAEEMVDFDLF